MKNSCPMNARYQILMTLSAMVVTAVTILLFGERR